MDMISNGIHLNSVALQNDICSIQIVSEEKTAFYHVKEYIFSAPSDLIASMHLNGRYKVNQICRCCKNITRKNFIFCNCI